MIIIKLNFLHKSASFFKKYTFCAHLYLASWEEGSPKVQMMIFVCFLWDSAPCRGQGKLVLDFFPEGLTRTLL